MQFKHGWGDLRSPCGKKGDQPAAPTLRELFLPQWLRQRR